MMFCRPAVWTATSKAGRGYNTTCTLGGCPAAWPVCLVVEAYRMGQRSAEPAAGLRWGAFCDARLDAQKKGVMERKGGMGFSVY